MNPLFLLFGALAGFTLSVVISFNRLITLKNRAKEAWSDIEVQLKRRYNLIPNLVETVKGYASHEKGIFEKVSAARSVAMGAKTMKEKQDAENMVSSTLKTLFAVSEAYPELKASSNFLELQKELRDTEDKIQASRRFYNTNVRDLNIVMEKFPTNLLVPVFKFQKMDFFEIENEEEKAVPKVNF